MRPELQNRIARLAADRESGASEILDAAIAVLGETLASDADVAEVARALCRAQPAMAPVWNAAIAALAARKEPARFTRFAQQVARAPDALARFALELFDAPVRSGGRAHKERTAERPNAPLRLVTISYSRTVLHVLQALATQRGLHVACSESRPALEGRTMATRLAAHGVAVTLFSDAAIGHALSDADAVLVGADAITPQFFFNKSGTRMLAAAAQQQGVSLYVLASRDKYVSQSIADRLGSRDAHPSEIWSDTPAGVVVRNPYFEATPLELAAGFVTDIGVVGAGEVPNICSANGRGLDDAFGALGLGQA